jgi:hypothetical protein
LFSHLLSKNAKIKIHKTVILSVITDGCEIWSLTLRDEHRLRVFENRVLRRIFQPKDGVIEENFIMSSSIIFTIYHILVGK